MHSRGQGLQGSGRADSRTRWGGSTGDFSLFPRPPPTSHLLCHSGAQPGQRQQKDGRCPEVRTQSPPPALPPHTQREPGLSASLQTQAPPIPRKGCECRAQGSQVPTGYSCQPAGRTPALSPTIADILEQGPSPERWLRGRGQPREQGPEDQPASSHTLPLPAVRSSRPSRGSKVVVSRRDWELNSWGAKLSSTTPSWEILGKSLYLSGPQFPQLQNGNHYIPFS